MEPVAQWTEANTVRIHLNVIWKHTYWTIYNTFSFCRHLWIMKWLYVCLSVACLTHFVAPVFLCSFFLFVVWSPALIGIALSGRLPLWRINTLSPPLSLKISKYITHHTIERFSVSWRQILSSWVYGFTRNEQQLLSKAKIWLTR